MERAEEVLETTLPPVTFTLPSASTITEFWPDIQHLVAVPQDLQRTIETPVQAVYVGFRLNQAILEGCITVNSLPRSLNTYEHLRPWALDACTSLWQSHCKWTNFEETSPIQNDVQAVYLEQLKLLALPDPNAEEDLANSQKATLAITSGLLDVLHMVSTSPMPEANQISLATLLAHLRRALAKTQEPDRLELSRRWRALEHMISDTLEPEIVACCRDVSKLSSLHRDLQVCQPHTFVNACLTSLL